MTSPPLTRVRFDYEEVAELSQDLLSSLEEADVTEGEAMVGLAMTLGRLLSPTRPMSPDEEVKFIESALEWAGAYFAKGGLN